MKGCDEGAGGAGTVAILATLVLDAVLRLIIAFFGAAFIGGRPALRFFIAGPFLAALFITAFLVTIDPEAGGGGDGVMPGTPPSAGGNPKMLTPPSKPKPEPPTI